MKHLCVFYFKEIGKHFTHKMVDCFRKKAGDTGKEVAKTK